MYFAARQLRHRLLPRIMICSRSADCRTQDAPAVHLRHVDDRGPTRGVSKIWQLLGVGGASMPCLQGYLGRKLSPSYKVRASLVWRTPAVTRRTSAAIRRSEKLTCWLVRHAPILHDKDPAPPCVRTMQARFARQPVVVQRDPAKRRMICAKPILKNNHTSTHRLGPGLSLDWLSDEQRFQFSRISFQPDSSNTQLFHIFAPFEV